MRLNPAWIRSVARQAYAEIDALAEPITLHERAAAAPGGFIDHGPLPAFISTFRAVDLIPGGPIDQGDLRAVINAAHWPAGLRRLNKGDRVTCRGEFYAVMNQDDATRSAGEIFGVDLQLRGGGGLMATTFARTSTIARGVATVPELVETIKWFNDLLPATAKAELQDAQAAGSLRDPVSFVDGKRNPNVDSVKPFGLISYTDAMGPMRQAIAAADTFVRTYAPRETGFYEGALRWFRSGRSGPRAVSGLPNADTLLPTSNVQLVDLAPYASTLEIEVPRGVIYGAYALLNRMFGGQLQISFSYAPPAEFGGLIERRAADAARPYAVPVLTIGQPGSSVRDGARPRPASQRGTRRREAGRLVRAARSLTR